MNADLVSLGDNLLGPAATANCGTVAASNDLVGVNNPNLAPLSAFGGPTPTHLPNPGSPAIDHGGVCPATDQRGLFRAPAAPCDAGAVEVGATTTLPTDPPVTTALERHLVRRRDPRQEQGHRDARRFRSGCR